MHIQRFFSYLSLFTFMMIILVSGGNYLLLFVGWEGNHNCLKWLNLLKTTTAAGKFKAASKVQDNSNIGGVPLNKENISLIVGSLMGNSYLEKSEKGVRIIFIKCNGNIEYLMKYFNYFYNIGWIDCKSNKPLLKKIITKNNKVLYYYNVKTHYLDASSGLYWIYDLFYVGANLRPIKTLPLNLKEYLTPLAISVWYLDNTDKLYISEEPWGAPQKFNIGSESTLWCLPYNELDYIIHIFK